MPKACSLCASPRRDEIDEALLSGATLRNIAERFGTSPQTALRHRAHVPERLALAKREAEVQSAETLAEKLRRLEEDLRRLLAKAEGEGDFRASIAAVRTALDLAALAHKVSETRVDSMEKLLDSPEWREVETTVAEALAPYPDAAEAVARALTRLDEKNDPEPRNATAGLART